ncbi:MAG: hypothetical protein AB8V06_08410 [Francisella endosymbiont of Hyalomma asiaticum]
MDAYNQITDNMFNPEKYIIILVDQRGCCKSIPFAELRESTTWHLIEELSRSVNSLGLING